MADSKMKEWTLVDPFGKAEPADWQLSHAELGHDGKKPWSVKRRILKGGLSDGVELIDVTNGDLAFSVCPTRGMGIWRGEYKGWQAGWKSPIRGPVHPAFVNLHDRGGIGWLNGFDEWIVRCGLESNGAPGPDVQQDNYGNKREMMLPLHGRIANLPAHRVVVRVVNEAPHAIEIVGVVEESTLFMPGLRLETVIRTIPGAKSFTIHDRITNFKSQPEEMQILYHCNFGPPLLEAGSRVLVPTDVLAPRDKTAEKAIDHFDTYPGPTSGVVEQVFFYQAHADAKSNKTLAMLHNKDSNKACGIRYSTQQLPCFTLWKNPGAESDGYVTGLEPGTNFPNHKSFERKQGRVVTLAPGAHYDVEVEFEFADGKEAVAALVSEVGRLQSQGAPKIHAKTVSTLSPG
ncbi:MAG: aldose 1-epimerase family protein [Planctomycetota bacterium]